MAAHRVIIQRIVLIILGVAIGLFAGLFIFGTLLRVVLHLLFGWGDHGPEWVNWIIFTGTGVSLSISVCFSIGGEFMIYP